MKRTRNRVTGALCALLAGAAAPAMAQTILIDYDDGDGGNGIHDVTVADGDFSTAVADPPNTPWTGLGGTIQYMTTLASGVGSAANYVTTLDRVLAADTGYDIENGASFDLGFMWRDASNWDGPDTVALVLYYTDDDTIDGSTDNILDAAVITDLVELDSGPRDATTTWETEAASDLSFNDPSSEGRRLFARIVARSAQGEFSRVDNIFVSVTPPPDPQLQIQSGNFDFGKIFHANGSSTTTRTVTFTNSGKTQDLTIDAISLTDDGGGVFSITGAPTGGTVIGPGGTFDVEVTATGGGGQGTLPGGLLVDVTPDDQDTAVPLRAIIATTGDPFLLVDNIDFETGLAPWSGNAVATTGLGSSGGARLRGIGDDRLNTGTVFSNVLAQDFGYTESGDFTATVSFAIPDFDTFAPLPADAGFYDRSFHLAVLGSTALPTGGVFDDADAANTLINLFYFPAGVSGDPGAGFFLYNGVTFAFDRLSGLGTLTPSTGFNDDGTPPATLNVYQLTVTGTGFGTGSASYDISISDANLPNVAASVSGLTTFHGVDPTTTTAKAIVLTTGDTGFDTTLGQVPQQASFWVDDVSVSLPQTLPLALFGLAEPPRVIKLFERSKETLSFSVTNLGYAADLTLDSPALVDPAFGLLGPSGFPQSLAPGETLEFEVEVDALGVSGESVLDDTLTLTTNDAIAAVRGVDLTAQVLEGGRRILIDYDDGIPGNGMHEASVRNGGFEEGVAGDDFGTTPSWFSRFSPEGDLLPLTFDDDPATGIRYGQTSGFSGTGERAQPAQLFAPDEWTLEAGDYFTIEVTWKDGPGFVEGDTVSVIMEVFDENGLLVGSPSGDGIDSRIISRLAPLAELGTYQTSTFVTQVIPDGDPWIGKRPLLRVIKSGARDTFAKIDNITLTGHMAEPDLSLTASSVDAATGAVTLRWADIGRLYKVQGTDDLDFSTNVAEFPVDGSADTTSYPGEIEFSISDPTGGSRRFWRVVTD